MKRKNWFYLFATNFVGVFNDNFLKYTVVYVAMLWTRPSWMNQSQIISLLSAAMVLPYLLLTPLSGYLAQRYQKYNVLRICKWIELPIILLALLGFMSEQIWLAIVAVMLMGIQSCLYSPAKYGLIRDIGGLKGASFGSGVFEAMAFLGILIGTVVASILSDHYNFYMFALIAMVLAILGVWFSSSLRVKELPPIKERASLNPFVFAVSLYKFCRHYEGLNLAIYGASMLWFFGSMLQMNLVIHTIHTLQCSITDSGLVLSVAALGIALGTYASGKLSRQGVKPGLIYIGLTGVSLSVLSILIFRPGLSYLYYSVFFAAFFGGMFQVPCLAMVQRSDTGRRLGDVIAYMNFVLFALVLVSTLLFSVVTYVTNQNSYAVFAFLLAASLFTLVLFVMKRHKIYHQP